jgi:hypothetical protein
MHQYAQDIYFVPEARLNVERMAQFQPRTREDEKNVSAAQGIVHLIAGFDALARMANVTLKHSDPACELARRSANDGGVGGSSAAAAAAAGAAGAAGAAAAGPAGSGESAAEKLTARQQNDDSWARVKLFLLTQCHSEPERQQVLRRSKRVMRAMYVHNRSITSLELAALCSLGMCGLR